MNKLSVSLAIFAFAAASQAALIFDQGPSTGTFAGSWVNQTASQNFADRVVLSSSATVGRYRYYTNFDPSSFGTFTLKLLADDGSGNPAAYLNTQVVSMAGFGFDSTNNGVNINYVDLNLTTPWNLSSGVTYWVGASGNGFEAAQVSLQTPGNGQMAQFAGATFTNHTGVGDQAFQLHDAVPEPATMTLLGLGAVAWLRRRKS